MAKAVRMSDIAERLHVSIVTVSKALAGKDGVSEELRQEILQLAEEMGYKNKKAKPVAAAKTYTLGIVTSYRYIEKDSRFTGVCTNGSCFIWHRPDISAFWKW